MLSATPQAIQKLCSALSHMQEKKKKTMSLLLGQDERKWLFALVSTDKVGRMHYSTHKAAPARALGATDGLFKQRAV